MSAKRYVLDSFALLSYLQDEAGARIVQGILADKSNEILNLVRSLTLSGYGLGSVLRSFSPDGNLLATSYDLLSCPSPECNNQRCVGGMFRLWYVGV